MRKPTTLSLALSASAAGRRAPGARSPPTTATVQARITSDLGNVLHEAKNASDGSTANLPGASVSALATVALGNASASARVIAPLQRLLAPRSAGIAAAPGTGFDPDATIQWLDDNLFTAQNDLGGGVYQVPPALSCTTTSVDSSGNTTQTVDADCVQRVTTAELRVRVEEDGATLRFAVQVDANHDEPLVFALTHTSLAITLDLDGADRAMIALAQAFGDQAPNASLSGQVTGELQVLGAAHVKLATTIDRAVAVKVADQGAALDGDSAFRLTSAAAPVFAIELDANAPLAALDLGLGETTLHVPGAPGEVSTDVDLAGATANATYAGGNTLTIDNLSLGTKTTTISKGGAQAIAIDLDPNDGRVLTAVITADPATGAETLAVSPRLDLDVATDHAVLGDQPPVYDVTRVLLDGSLASVPGSDTTRVASGSFSIATDPAQYGFVASAGQCVTSSDATDPATLQTYTAYAVGACP